MNKIKELQVKKLLKELDFIESDFNYKNEMISEADSNFLKAVSVFLEKHPELKLIFEKKINHNLDTIFNKKETDDNFEESEFEVSDSDHEDVIEESDSKLKNLYRKIVKLTHPDKIENKKLNELYLKSTIYYDKSDLIGLYLICNELNIDFEVLEDEFLLIENKIDLLKDRVKFMESTLTWMWYVSDDEKQREKLILNYISQRLNN